MDRIKGEEAVSPVVGVMLMLVVTIIIAAVVSSFAGGLVGEQKKTPTVSVEVALYMNYDWQYGDNSRMSTNTSPEIWFKNVGGDSVPTSDLEIITYYTIPSTGEVIKHTVDGSLNCDDTANHGNPGNVGFPKLNDMSRQSTQDFGQFIWCPGDFMEARGGDIKNVLGFSPKEDRCEFKKGSVVEVKILYKPTGQYIYQGTVSAI